MTTESPIEARLRDIEARCAAATKGKWQAGVPAIDPGYVFTLDPGDGRSIAKIGEDIEEADTELIAHAGGDGGDLAWIVALVRRYRAALERIADEPCTRYVRGNDGISRVVVRHQAVAREALNEEG